MIDALKKEDAVACTHIVKFINGQPHKKSIKREYKDMLNGLCKLCGDRVGGRKTIPELLHGVGYNIRWKPARKIINYIELWTINYTLAIYLYCYGWIRLVCFILYLNDSILIISSNIFIFDAQFKNINMETILIIHTNILKLYDVDLIIGILTMCKLLYAVFVSANSRV